MPFTPSNYTVGGTQTYVQANNGETQYTEATQSFEQDLFTPFVYSGLVATRDGTTLSQLDVTAGVAFLLQTDSTLRRRAPIASTQSATGHVSATLYLDLNPDGSWSWATTHSAQAGYLPIASVVTDSSANISTVTDARTLGTTLLTGMGGPLFLPNTLILNNGFLVSGAGTLVLEARQSGAAGGMSFTTWDGAASHVPFSVGGQLGGALAWVDNSGNIFAGGYLQSNSGAVWSANGTLTLYAQQSGVAHGVAFTSWDGAATHTPFSIGGQFNGALAWVDNSGNIAAPIGAGIPTTRNGAAASVPIFTGANTPSSPPTGAIWLNK